MAGQKSPGVAAVLSVLIPGLGQIYNGEIGKGIVFILLAVVFAILIVFLIGIFLYFGLWIYGIYDAYHGAERYNQSHPSMPQPGMYAPAPMAPPAGGMGGQLACPECGRQYSTSQGRFCTVDGAELRPVT